MQLSKNFTLEELTRTHSNLPNIPTQADIERLQALVNNVLQPLRDLYGKAICINSGYRSKADFIHKLNISLKEANETEYWLMLLHDTEYLDEKSFNSIVSDCQELIKMLISIIKTSKKPK